MDSESLLAARESLELFDVKICGGPTVATGSVISILYRVALSENDLLAGRLIESNYNPDIPLEVKVAPDALLPGVYATLLGMRAGGSVRRVRIPPQLAYGSRGAKGVPPDSELWAELCVSRILSDESGDFTLIDKGTDNA